MRVAKPKARRRPFRVVIRVRTMRVLAVAFGLDGPASARVAPRIGSRAAVHPAAAPRHRAWRAQKDPHPCTGRRCLRFALEPSKPGGQRQGLVVEFPRLSSCTRTPSFLNGLSIHHQ